MRRYILAIFTSLLLVVALGSVGAYILYLRENSQPVGITPKINIVVPLNLSSIGLGSRGLYPSTGEGVHGGNLTIFEQVVKTPEGEEKLLVGGKLPFKNGIVRLSTPQGSYTYLMRNGSFRFLLPILPSLGSYNATLFYNGTAIGEVPINALFGQNVTLKPVKSTSNGVVVKVVAQNGSPVRNSAIVVSLNGQQTVIYTGPSGTAFLGYRNASIKNLSAEVVSVLPFPGNVSYRVLNVTKEGPLIKVFSGNRSLSNSYIPVKIGNQTYYLKTNSRGIARIPSSNFTLFPPIKQQPKSSPPFLGRALLMYALLSLIVLGMVYIASSGMTIGIPTKLREKRSPFVLERCVYLAGEKIKIRLNKGAEVILDGKKLGSGKEFELVLNPGIHKLIANGWIERIYIFEEPTKALIKLYETTFLDLVRKLGVDPTDKTPHEIMESLKDVLPVKPLMKITTLFEEVKYGNRRITREEFLEFLSALNELLRGDTVEES